MHTEFEERILEVDIDKVTNKLISLGAEKVGEWFQKRYVYDFTPPRDSQWIRLRTNGEVTTLCYKNVEKNTVDGTHELEVEVSDFDETNELLNVLGYKAKGYQENKRVRYILDGVEVDIDTWPMIPTYMEIEAESEERVKEIEKLLEVDPAKVTALNCEDIYIDIYGIDVEKIKELKF